MTAAEAPAARRAGIARPGRAAAILSLILLLGGALRIQGIGWSLPDARHPLATYHPDELINLGAARAADIPHGKLDIGFYNYGAFYFYLVSLAQTVVEGYGGVPAVPQVAADASPEERMSAGAPQQAALFLTGRVVTALMGLMTTGVVYLAGTQLFGRRTGLGAALLYALCPLAVVHAHFLTVDVPATLFVSLALLYAARLLSAPNWREYTLAAVSAGLAAATKYTAGLVLAAPLAAHFLNMAPGACRKHRAAQLALLLLLTGLVFLIACPGPWLNPDVFWNGSYPGSGVRYELFEHARQGHGELFSGTGPGWWYHLVVSLRFGLGLPLLGLSLAGLAMALIRRSRQDLVLLSFIVIYYLLTGSSAVRFARYMIPLFPALCVLGARLLLLAPRAEHRKAAVGVFVVVSLLTLTYTAGLTSRMAAEDPRDSAATYLERTAPQGASVAFAKVPWFYSPPLSPWFGAPAAPQRARSAASTTRYRLLLPASEWDATALLARPDYVVISNLETMHAVDRLHVAAPSAYMRAIPADYGKTVFGPPAGLLAAAGGGTIIPEDLLYVMPTLTLYSRR